MLELDYWRKAENHQTTSYARENSTRTKTKGARGTTTQVGIEYFSCCGCVMSIVRKNCRSNPLTLNWTL
ncbi:hypothetical protein PV328_006254 [Microctonus aethiopoides]|uniref:Uncharacterized protein n=1 Tax=Microctonus aethiopoides TaxID=144406 RepID=A0AA39FPG9_9HYME|nr:hypothetical protein PV328_006254 [Microctonus aethiopoides]